MSLKRLAKLRAKRKNAKRRGPTKPYSQVSIAEAAAVGYGGIAEALFAHEHNIAKARVGSRSVNRKFLKGAR